MGTESHWLRLKLIYTCPYDPSLFPVTILSTLTPIGSRLQIALDAEDYRMANEWFFKWHQIGRESSVHIDSFDGRMIHYGGIAFAGTARDVYWQTIQRYARKKVGELFDQLEADIQRYPIEVRLKALNEALALIRQFVAKIRKQAVAKDRVLRGNGIEFPQERDIGSWEGAQPSDIEARVETLRQIYCKPSTTGMEDRVFDEFLNDKVTLVKKDGAVARENVKCLVTKGKIQIHDATLPIEVGDHLLRRLPNELVEDYLVLNPQLHSGLAEISAFYIVDVRRTDAPVAQQGTVIHSITVSGANSRVTVGADNSINTTVTTISGLQVASLVEQVKSALAGLPEPTRARMSEPLALLESEIRTGNPDQDTLRSGLMSMKTIAEEAAGNLVAAGIGAMIGPLLGG